MSKTKMIGDMSAWAGMMKDFWRQVSDGSITIDMFSAFLQHKNPFEIIDVRQEWQKFYRKYFHLRVDFSDVQIPDNPSDFDRIIFIPKGLKISDVFKAIGKQFRVDTYPDDFDNNITDIVRSTNKNYAIRLRELVEAEEKFENISDFKDEDINTLTLLERLVFELKYWSETSEHLDVNSVTLCLGSRHRNCTGTLGVYWNSNFSWLRVEFYNPNSTCGPYHLYQVVS